VSHFVSLLRALPNSLSYLEHLINLQFTEIKPVD